MEDVLTNVSVTPTDDTNFSGKQVVEKDNIEVKSAVVADLVMDSEAAIEARREEERRTKREKELEARRKAEEEALRKAEAEARKKRLAKVRARRKEMAYYD